MTGSSIDVGPLVDPISRIDVRDFARASISGYHSRARVLAASIAQLVFSAIVISIALAFSAFVLSDVFERRLPVGVILLVAAICVLLGGSLVFYALWAVVRRVRLRNPWPRRMRLTRFAAANGMEYLPESIPPNVHSSVFGSDETATTTDRFIRRGERYLEFGNAHRSMSTWSASPTLRWGYLLVDLGVPLPHMALRSRAVQSRYPNKSMPVAFAAGQTLSLEGDFDKHFTLYAPRGYQRDALYVFTPDLMAMLIDDVATFDVEIVDHWLLVYSPTPFDLSSPRTITRLFAIADVAGAKLQRQARRYSDQRADDQRIGIAGRRLKTRIAAASVIFMVLWVAYFAARLVQATT